MGLLAGEIRQLGLYSDGGTLREIDTHPLLSFGLVKEKIMVDGADILLVEW
jgi:hypothetical protein